MKKIIIIFITTLIALSSLTFSSISSLQRKNKLYAENNYLIDEEEENIEYLRPLNHNLWILFIFIIFIFLIFLVASVFSQKETGFLFDHETKQKKMSRKEKEKEDKKKRLLFENLSIPMEQQFFFIRIAKYYLQNILEIEKEEKKQNILNDSPEAIFEIKKGEEKKHYLFDKKNDKEIKKIKTNVTDENYLIYERINKESDWSYFLDTNKKEILGVNFNFFLFSFLSIRNLIDKSKIETEKYLSKDKKGILNYNICGEYKIKTYIKDNYTLSIHNRTNRLCLFVRIICMIFLYCLNIKFNDNNDIKELFFNLEKPQEIKKSSYNEGNIQIETDFYEAYEALTSDDFANCYKKK